MIFTATIANQAEKMPKYCLLLRFTTQKKLLNFNIPIEVSSYFHMEAKK